MTHNYIHDTHSQERMMMSFCYCGGLREEKAVVKVEFLWCVTNSISGLVLASVRGKCE